MYKILVEEDDRLKQFKDSKETRPTVFYLNDYLLVLKEEMWSQWKWILILSTQELIVVLTIWLSMTILAEDESDYGWNDI